MTRSELGNVSNWRTEKKRVVYSHCMTLTPVLYHTHCMYDTDSSAVSHTHTHCPYDTDSSSVLHTYFRISGRWSRRDKGGVTCRIWWLTGARNLEEKKNKAVASVSQKALRSVLWIRRRKRWKSVVRPCGIFRKETHKPP